MNYFYGDEAERFVFYRISKGLITDKRFECFKREAKLLCGLMLDRMALSLFNASR